MTDIKLARSQALLQELLTEALGTLSNPNLNTLSVTQVRCSKGKYHAEVLLHPSDFTTQEQALILKELNKAKGILQEYVLNASGWFKCPNFAFGFDESLEGLNRLDQIFAQLAQEKDKS
ncbi:ribosome-binding factor A [Helicobacter enhydrae]|uniref:Ribosome-binding factor A n=1 Tax=Helicobacter enhydrae TaxID=222136 RepID=A0A1B1U5Z7_9HELI|nr:30S ribosome-binding factor RbfA [Helicobacter enhydrae]ANV98122.1 ribosome-binding factor A [Helicobacter enhydrae]